MSRDKPSRLDIVFVKHLEKSPDAHSSSEEPLDGNEFDISFIKMRF